MPFTEVGSSITGLFRDVSYGDLFGTHGPVWGEGAISNGMSACEDAAAGWGAGGVSGIEMIEPEPVLGHVI